MNPFLWCAFLANAVRRNRLEDAGECWCRDCCKRYYTKMCEMSIPDRIMVGAINYASKSA